MSVGKQISIGEFAQKEIPDLQTRARFLGVMLGLSLGKTVERAAQDFRLTKDDIVWTLIEKYEATISKSDMALLFAEREISDPVIKEIFLQLAPKLLLGKDISDVVERRSLHEKHPVWALLEKYFNELLENKS